MRHEPPLPDGLTPRPNTDRGMESGSENTEKQGEKRAGGKNERCPRPDRRPPSSRSWLPGRPGRISLAPGSVRESPEPGPRCAVRCGRQTFLCVFSILPEPRKAHANMPKEFDVPAVPDSDRA